MLDGPLHPRARQAVTRPNPPQRGPAGQRSLEFSRIFTPREQVQRHFLCLLCVAREHPLLHPHLFTKSWYRMYYKQGVKGLLNQLMHWPLSGCWKVNRTIFVSVLVWRPRLTVQVDNDTNGGFILVSIRLKQNWRRKNKSCRTWLSHYVLITQRETRQYRWEYIFLILWRLILKSDNLLTKAKH